LRKLASARSRRDGLQVLAWPAFRKQAANPHAALLPRELIGLGVDLVDWTPLRALLRPRDLWHLHHPETVLYRRSAAASTLEMVAFLALLWLARLRGVRMLWTAHDLGSNDGLHPRLERWFWQCFIPGCDALVCLSARSRTLLLERFPTLAGRPMHVVSHGGYHEAYASTVTREDARAHFRIAPEAMVLLHFGLMRP
jgi:beta-1,4-mannosyltransferase